MGLVEKRSAEMGCRIRNVVAVHVRMFVMGTAPPAWLSDWAGFLFGFIRHPMHRCRAYPDVCGGNGSADAA